MSRIWLVRYTSKGENAEMIDMMDDDCDIEGFPAMNDKLYRCCNTCAYRDDSFIGCSKASECYNGFSAYAPNKAMKEQEEADHE